MPRSAPQPAWHTAQVAGADIHYMAAGSGDPLLFLHGWGMSPRSYLPSVARLCRAGVRVIAPSLPGFGRSAPLDDLSMSGYAECVAGLLDHLDIERPAFVMGHSFGGGIAIQLAADRPDLVRSLTLLNTVGGSPGRPALRVRPDQALTTRPWWQWALAAAAEVDPRGMLRRSPRDATALAASVVRDLMPNLVRRPITSFRTALLALSADLVEPVRVLIDSGMPVLFVWGDGDRLVVPGAFSDLVNKMPPEIVKGRHGWLLTAPDEFAQLLHNTLVVHAMLERSTVRRASANGTKPL